eukprot:8585166-Alexandrium_andersonii.AAC.1
MRVAHARSFAWPHRRPSSNAFVAHTEAVVLVVLVALVVALIVRWRGLAWLGVGAGGQRCAGVVGAVSSVLEVA